MLNFYFAKSIQNKTKQLSSMFPDCFNNYFKRTYDNGKWKGCTPRGAWSPSVRGRLGWGFFSGGSPERDSLSPLQPPQDLRSPGQLGKVLGSGQHKVHLGRNGEVGGKEPAGQQTRRKLTQAWSGVPPPDNPARPVRGGPKATVTFPGPEMGPDLAVGPNSREGGLAWGGGWASPRPPLQIPGASSAPLRGPLPAPGTPHAKAC